MAPLKDHHEPLKSRIRVDQGPFNALVGSTPHPRSEFHLPMKNAQVSTEQGPVAFNPSLTLFLNGRRSLHDTEAFLSDITIMRDH
jgi:hypothetical protein